MAEGTEEVSRQAGGVIAAKAAQCGQGGFEEWLGLEKSARVTVTVTYGTRSYNYIFMSFH